MPIDIELTETSPGHWEVVKRLPGKAGADPSEEELEARREAFFDSLAGHSTKRQYMFEGLHWAHFVMGFYSIPIFYYAVRYLLSAL